MTPRWPVLLLLLMLSRWTGSGDPLPPDVSVLPMAAGAAKELERPVLAGLTVMLRLVSGSGSAAAAAPPGSELFRRLCLVLEGVVAFLNSDSLNLLEPEPAPVLTLLL